MASGTAGFRYFILGLLTQRAMSGYDIKRFLESLGWLMGSPSFGMIYPALHALLRDGLVTVEVMSRESKPPRKIYSITEDGEQVLREWLNQPTKANASLRSFIMRLSLASSFVPDRLAGYLKDRRDQVAAQHANLRKMINEMDQGVDHGQRLALDYSIAVADAELAWLDRTLRDLAGELHPNPSIEAV
jgi:PadR family transcriptional regulator AphA